MNLKRDWRNGDLPLILGAGIYLVFSQLHLLSSSVFEMPTMFLSWLGVGWMVANLRRSNLERAIRWFLGANLVHFLLILARHPHLAESSMGNVLILALAIGLVGGLVPMAMRRKAYGFLLAFLWAALLAEGWEEMRSNGFQGVLSTLLLAGVLAALTTFYGRWVRTGQFPRVLREVIDQLPKDDTPLKTTFHASTNGKSLPKLKVLDKEPEPERVRVGER